jgi:radical SAM/Cys-rich protein
VSLKSAKSPLSTPEFQLDYLDKSSKTSFVNKLKEHNMLPLRTTGLEILQINLGKMCNQTCTHCHVDAGPDRKEIMTEKVMIDCLEVIKKSEIKTVDLTGGAPEMNPHFRWFVSEISKLGVHIIVRCNLTIIEANPKYYDLPDFFKENRIEVVSSLPHYTSFKTDRQRGDGVFNKSISALKRLNAIGYGLPEYKLLLNLVYNPAGAFLPGAQSSLEKDFKNKLKSDFGIVFNNLYCITNLPISRYLDYLVKSENLDSYMDTLISAFNPTAAQNVMCRNMISVG